VVLPENRVVLLIPALSTFLKIQDCETTKKAYSVEDTLPTIMVTLRSSEISSFRGPYPEPSVFPFNFADLNHPVPLSAWYGLWEYSASSQASANGLPLRETLTSTLWDGLNYKPIMPMPEIVKQFLPAEWATCEVDVMG
jgi:hypothetical protein